MRRGSAGEGDRAARQERVALDALFRPRAVAVIGATDRPGSVGVTVMKNLQAASFGGPLVPVNPRHGSVFGLPAYPCIQAVPSPVDLAIIITPAATVPGVVAECVEAGVRAAIVISAGFRECGEAGAALEEQMLAAARRGGMRLLGPNCLGLIVPASGLNATFAAAMPEAGRVAFLSQSGALCTAILDWSLLAHVGFSAFVSVGSMLDVGWGDLIAYLGDDPATTSIVIYMESIGDGRAFLSAARKVAPIKPIIVIKAGRTEAAAKAAASHTGALAGSDLALDAAFRRSGVLRVDSMAELFSMADVLGKQPRPAGPRLTIVTNAGGPGVLATDALIANGGELAIPSPAALHALDDALPPAWSHGNPIDILGDASTERYRRALRIAIADEQSDGLLVIYCRQGIIGPGEAAAVVKAEAPASHKPVLASWMGGETSQVGRAVLDAAGIPSFAYPDSAARTFTQMWRYTYNLRGLDEAPERTPHASAEQAAAASIIAAARSRGRTLLTEIESKHLLAAYGLPVAETRLAANERQAVAQAEAIGYPVVLKLHSETITHKAAVGGVVLHLAGPAAVREAFGRIREVVTAHAGAGDFLGVTVQPMILRDGIELILGSSLDAQFGPVLLFGAGGRLVEAYGDRALALPPLTTSLARRLMEQTKIFAALRGGRRGAPLVDVAALEHLLVRFSWLVVEQRRIREIDLNPLLASGDQLLALDARIVLHPATIADADLPEPAIRA